MLNIFFSPIKSDNLVQADNYYPPSLTSFKYSKININCSNSVVVYYEFRKANYSTTICTVNATFSTNLII
jgi:hypothetical protein